MRKSLQIATNWLQVIMVALPAMLAGFGFVCIVFLLMGQFRTEYVVSLGLIVSAGVLLVIRHEHKKGPLFNADKELVLCLLIGVAFILSWVGFNLNYNAEHVFINRDPGTYTVSSKILESESDLEINKVRILSESDGFFSSAAGFDTSIHDNKELFAQGAHLLPSLLGLGSRFFGNEAIFNGNIVLAGVALLTFFGFCLNFIRPRFAIMALIALGLLLPFIYFSRDTYTEILALTFVFGMLTILHNAIKRRSSVLWFLAGLTLGAGALMRIDAYLSIAAALLFVGVYLVLQRNMHERKTGLKHSAWFFLGTLLTSAVGFFDLYLLSSGYFVTEWRYLSLEIYLILILAVVTSTGVFLSWKTGALEVLNRETKRWRSKIAVAAFIIFWLITGSRFLWSSESPRHKASELMVPFIAAYIGPILFILGITGLAIIIHRALGNRDLALKLMPFLLIVVSTAMLYITRPSISPDHVWASRRLLPIVLPGLIFAGMYVFHLAYIRLMKKRKTPKWHKEKKLFYLTAVIATISPLILSYPFLTLSPFKQYSAIEKMCSKIPNNSLVVLFGRLGMDSTLATRAFCGVDTVRYTAAGEKIDSKSLAAALDRVNDNGKHLIVGVYEKEVDILPPNSDLSVISKKVSENVELVYRRPPTKIIYGQENILLGRVDDNGTITGLNE